jgi:hypothetical protein
MPGSALKTPAEHQFETYLFGVGLDGADDHEPDLGGEKRPDYRVSRGEAAVIIELKGFESSPLEMALEASSDFLVRDGRQELAPMRNKVGEAIKQLRPYRDRPEPLIVCLANPNRLQVPCEDHEEVIAGMYGERGVQVSIATPENPGPPLDPEWFFGRNGVFGGGLHPYVSAVMTLHERTRREDAIERWHQDLKERLADIEDRQERAILTAEATREPAFAEADATQGNYHFVRVFETHHVGATAPRVPRDLFAGPHDEFRAYNPGNGCLELLR